MNNHAADIKKLNERLKSVSAVRMRIPDSGKRMRVGQLWTVSGLNAEDPGWLFLVLEELEQGLFNAVPCFRWTEWAGPSDLFLPRELAGSTLIVSFESESTVSREMLGSCCERLPQQAIDYVLQARATMDNPVERQAFSWGLDYFGRHCVRLARHEDIHAHIETLQTPLRAKIFQQIPEYDAKPEKAGIFVLKWLFPVKSFPVRVVAIAAGLCLLLGIGYLGMRHFIAPDIISVAVQDETDNLQFARADEIGMFPLVDEMRFRSPDPLLPYDSANPPVAYLLDARGVVQLDRSGIISVDNEGCVVLQKEDLITLGSNGSATVLFPENAFHLDRPGTYRIVMADVVRTIEGKEDSVEPILGMRGRQNSLLPTDRAGLVMTPPDLFASVKPLLMRAGAASDILCPVGTVYSTMPALEWIGEESAEYEVSIRLISDNALKDQFPWRKVRGCRVPWNITGWPKLKRGECGFLIVRKDGKLFMDTDAVFFIMDSKTAEPLLTLLDDIDTRFSEGITRDFLKANILLHPKWGCASEASVLARALVVTAPNNSVFLELLGKCYTEIGSSAGMKEVQNKLDTIRKK